MPVLKSAGILGAGFGLYGHLPAAVTAGAENVVLLNRYRNVFADRSELNRFKDCVRWVETEDDLLAVCDTLVLARAPSANFRLLPACLRHPNIQRFMIEKPPGPTPSAARAFFDQLASTSCRVSLPFRHLGWAKSALRFLRLEENAAGELNIEWSFIAHHFRGPKDTWKKRHIDGGGPLRFYGIHLIALLAEAGFETAESSSVTRTNCGSFVRWEAHFVRPGRASARVSVDSNIEKEIFSVTALDSQAIEVTSIFESKSPFGMIGNGAERGRNSQDFRVASLGEVYKSFREEDLGFMELNAGLVRLWESVEHITSFD